MSDEPRRSSTMTRLLRSSAEDALLHRALALPERYRDRIAFANPGDPPAATKYAFVSPQPIGEGGTAVVYRVRDTQLNVDRALKVLLVDLTPETEAEKRWRRERELLIALEKVDAPCVPTICDVGMVDGLPVIVMQFVEGITLASKLHELGPQHICRANDVEKYLRFVMSLIIALAKSFDHIEKEFSGTPYHGFAHGDIKPSNIVVEPKGENADAFSWEIGRVWLLDFGEASIQSLGEPRGLTPAYSSPEQLAAWAEQRSPRITAATDQYQLGVVLQELLRPIEFHRNRWHRSLKLTLSSWQIQHLSRVAGKMTARRPTDRFADFRSTLGALQRTESLPRRRGMLSAAALAAACVVLVLILSLAHRAPADSRDSRPLDSGLVETSVENEWKRWQSLDLRRATRQQLDRQLAVQLEEWRSAYGKATADAVVEELRRRSALLSGGQYSLQVIGAVPDDGFNQRAERFPDQSPDTVLVMLSVDELEVGKLRRKSSITPATRVRCR